MHWYSVTGLFRWFLKSSGDTSKFEERTILVRAESFDDAIDMAETEAIEYCENDPEANFLVESLDKYFAYEILEDSVVSGVEIMSRRFDSSLSSSEYIEKGSTRWASNEK